MSDHVSASWKVPFRQVYSASFWGWVRATFRCHVGLPIAIGLGLIAPAALIPGDEGDGSGTGG